MDGTVGDEESQQSHQHLAAISERETHQLHQGIGGAAGPVHVRADGRNSCGQVEEVHHPDGTSIARITLRAGSRNSSVMWASISHPTNAQKSSARSRPTGPSHGGSFAGAHGERP